MANVPTPPASQLVRNSAPSVVIWGIPDIGFFQPSGGGAAAVNLNKFSYLDEPLSALVLDPDSTMDLAVASSAAPPNIDLSGNSTLLQNVSPGCPALDIPGSPTGGGANHGNIAIYPGRPFFTASATAPAAATQWWRFSGQSGLHAALGNGNPGPQLLLRGYFTPPPIIPTRRNNWELPYTRWVIPHLAATTNVSILRVPFWGRKHFRITIKRSTTNGMNISLGGYILPTSDSSDAILAETLWTDNLAGGSSIERLAVDDKVFDGLSLDIGGAIVDTLTWDANDRVYVTAEAWD